MNTIQRDTLQHLLQQQRVVVAEALPQRYFDSGHLPGAVHLPHDQIDALAASRLPDRDARIVVYCANAQCQNSHIAAQRLTALGYRDVAVYAAGKQDWSNHGLQLEMSQTAAPAEA